MYKFSNSQDRSTHGLYVLTLQIVVLSFVYNEKMIATCIKKTLKVVCVNIIMLLYIHVSSQMVIIQYLYQHALG